MYWQLWYICFFPFQLSILYHYINFYKDHIYSGYKKLSHFYCRLFLTSFCSDCWSHVTQKELTKKEQVQYLTLWKILIRVEENCQNITCTMEHRGGHHQQVEKMGHQCDITKNRESLQNLLNPPGKLPRDPGATFKKL